jgi:hypothetical protein
MHNKSILKPKAKAQPCAHLRSVADQKDIKMKPGQAEAIRAIQSGRARHKSDQRATRFDQYVLQRAIFAVVEHFGAHFPWLHALNVWYVRVCGCECVYVCMRVCTYVCIFYFPRLFAVYVHECVYVCMYVCIYTWGLSHTHTHGE